MAQKAAYEKVDLLLVLPQASNRTSLRHTLTDLEFHNIRIGASVADMQREIETCMPDLIISDSDLPDGDICELVSDVRYHKIGDNPFLPVIIMTWNPSAELVHKVVDSGADDLLIQPTSGARLGERLDFLTFKRSPFVVTADYIGPDRHQKPRLGPQTLPLVDVPNALRARATGEMDSVSLQRAIDEMATHFTQQKLERDADTIEFLVSQLMPSYKDGLIDQNLRRNLRDLLIASQETGRRVMGTPFEHIAKLCSALATVVHRLSTSVQNPAQKDLQLLPLLSMGIKVAFVPDEATAVAAQDISVAVRQIRSA